MTEAEYGELKQKITTVVAAMKKMTVWEAIEDLVKMLPGQGPDDSNEPDMMVDRDDAEAEPTAGLYETVKEYLAKFGSCVSLTVKLDQKGKFAGMDVSVDIPDIAKGKVQIVLGHQSEKDYESAVSKVQEKLNLLKSDKVEKMVRAYFAAEDIELTTVSYDAQTGELQIKYTTRASTYVHSERGDKDFYVQWTQDVTHKVNLNDLAQLSFTEDESGVELVVEVSKCSVGVFNVRNVSAYWAGSAVDLTEEEMEELDVNFIADASSVKEVDGKTVSFLLVSASAEGQGTEQ